MNWWKWLSKQPIVSSEAAPYLIDHASKLHEQVPGLLVEVDFPAGLLRDSTGAPIKMTIEKTIITLNDHFLWSFHDIADWLDTLDVDLSFRKT